MGLNVLEWIWLNLKYALIIRELNLYKKIYVPIPTYITNDIFQDNGVLLGQKVIPH